MNLPLNAAIQVIQNHASPADWRGWFSLHPDKPNWLYLAYLGSLAWKKKREERLAIDNGKCQGCLLSGFMDIHHKTYRNIGDENVKEDLVTLCRNCHTTTHSGKPILMEEISALIGGLQRLRILNHNHHDNIHL